MIKTRDRQQSRIKSATPKSRYVNWWLYSLPPLHGALRFLVYGTLLLSALFQSNKSPIRGFQYYEATDPRLFRSYGLVKLLYIPYIAPEYLQIAIAIVILAWFCAAIGLFTRLSMIVTAVGVFFLHGMFLGSNAFNHNWFLPMYAMIALCFARTNDAWSVDYHLSKIRHRRTRKSDRPATIADTGFARQLFLVCAVGFYFAAGMSKLHTAGLAWGNGHLIQYFAESHNVQPLGPLLANNLWLSMISAVISLCLELGAIAALFSRKARFILVLGWLSLHVGIRYSLGLKYIQNIICLALLVDWSATAATAKQWLIAGKRKLQSKRFSLSISRFNPPYKDNNNVSGTLAGVIGGTCLILLMAAVALGQIFWWPFTTVYMYSSNFSGYRDIRADYPRREYYNVPSVQKIAREFLDTQPSIEATEYLAFRVCLRLAGDRQQPFYLVDNSIGVPEWKQWILTIARPILIEDLATKPLNQIEFNPDRPEYPAQKFLANYAPILRDRLSPEIWQQYDRLELVYPLEKHNSIAIADKDPIPEELWQHYGENGSETVTIPTARFVPIASVLLEDVS